jgi:hypothetical protein
VFWCCKCSGQTSATFLVLQMLRPDFSNFVFLPSVGTSGGILIAWKDGLGSLGNSRIDNFSVSVQFYPAGGTAWWLTCVWTTRQRGQDAVLIGAQQWQPGPWLHGAVADCGRLQSHLQGRG